MSFPEYHEIELDLDNETLATTHDAIVLTVGGVLTRGDEVLEKVHFRLVIDEQLDLGRKFSASTWKWWMEQSDDARKALFDVPEVKVSTGRSILRDVGQKAKRVWARPAMFDLPMLRHLFGQDLWDDANPKRPNHGYQKENDFGTLVQEFDRFRVHEPSFEGTAHNALDDAMHHHQWRMALRRELFQRGAYTPVEEPNRERIWTCKIGPCDIDMLPDQADGPMRDAVSAAFTQVTSKEPKFIFSGWSGVLTKHERDVVDGKAGCG